MWLSSKLVDLFNISKETVQAQREDLAATRVERDTLRFQLQVAHNTCDWLKAQVNTLQFERVALLEKAYGVRTPVPEIVRAPVMAAQMRSDEISFDDMGEDMAKRLGFPTYADKQ